MSEEKGQKELFEFKEPKRSFSKLAGMLPKADFEGRMVITLTLERVIFISIGIIMLMVLIYAFGIEKGKAISNKLPQNKIAQTLPGKTTPSQIKPVAPAQRNVPTQGVTAKVKEAQQFQGLSKPYTIVVAALSKKEGAIKEIGRLKKAGFDAIMVESDPYFLACVGAYPDRDSAKLTLSKLKGTYRDAYVRLR